MSEAVPSPCTGVCALDPAGTCRGCGRTLDEIGAWAAADNRAKRRILAAVAARRRAG